MSGARLRSRRGRPGTAGVSNLSQPVVTRHQVGVKGFGPDTCRKRRERQPGCYAGRPGAGRLGSIGNYGGAAANPLLTGGRRCPF